MKYYYIKNFLILLGAAGIIVNLFIDQKWFGIISSLTFLGGVMAEFKFNWFLSPRDQHDVNKKEIRKINLIEKKLYGDRNWNDLSLQERKKKSDLADKRIKLELENEKLVDLF